MRTFIRNFLTGLAGLKTPAPATSGEPDAPQADPRDAQLAQARQELADVRARITELTDQVVKLTTAVNQRTTERDAHAADLERAQLRLAATHHAQHAKTDGGVWRYADPPPTSDRTLYLREKKRADDLAQRLAAAEEELRKIRYPRVRQDTSA